MKYIFLFIAIFMLFSCKKTENKIKLSYITDDKNYKTIKKQENDTIYQISGENKQYILLSGYKDVKNGVKVGWWRIKDKNNNYLYEIEYISLNKNKENQIKFYNNGELINSFSQYYDIKYVNNGYEFKFYFPQNNYESTKVEFSYITSDNIIPPTREMITCKKEGDYYICFIPVKNKNQLIAGVVTEFTTSKGVGGKIQLTANSMYVNTPR
ncbi:hypothetical protein KB553_06770 [Chryseobacterium rhizoplanae]|uniref:hypothetical protein n=1 Tax=Chryseobacterium rhizoplanae TaxID=1609531 RepID=UPI001CE2CA48|nr:hypothetical protein [Chryseobacterium rhizoplanae]UCA61228.1 hypothetical protein KB553_06770 [Chryseobacterium rhizoplanae]